mgnify:CR=1 FL=1
MNFEAANRGMWDLPMDSIGGKPHINHIYGNIAYVIIAFVFKICFRYRVDHRESLRGFKDKTGVVVVGNHRCEPHVVSGRRVLLPGRAPAPMGALCGPRYAVREG